jgi:putative transposase
VLAELDELDATGRRVRLKALVGTPADPVLGTNAIQDRAPDAMTSEGDERNPSRTVEACRRLDKALRAVADEIFHLDTRAERGQSTTSNASPPIGGPMKKSRHTEEQIIAVLKEVDAGAKVQDVVRRLGVTEQTYYRWKAKYGGMEVSDAKKLKALEDENRRLKQMVADQALDIQALKAVVAKKW